MIIVTVNYITMRKYQGRCAPVTSYGVSPSALPMPSFLSVSSTGPHPLEGTQGHQRLRPQPPPSARHEPETPETTSGLWDEFKQQDAKCGRQSSTGVKILGSSRRGLAGFIAADGWDATGIDMPSLTYLGPLLSLKMTNNYDEDVYNGDLGTVHSVDERDRRLEVGV